CFSGVFLAGAMLIYQACSLEDTKGRKIVYRARGFYGVATVTEMPAQAGQGDGVIREFIHGSTVHGIQALIPGKERMPTTYYTETGGGFAIQNHPNWKTGRPMRVGLVGMGIGVLAGWCRTNDQYRCYEISPDVVRIATDPHFFTFISGAPGKVEVIAGDARKKLQAEVAHGEPLFDVLVIDAFTGDNIPYHLSTREAFALYFERLKPDGILAVNISNWHMDLMPFAKAVSIDFDCSVIALSADKDLNKLAFGSVYAIYCRQPGELAIPPKVKIVDFTSIPDHRMPTDEKGSFVKYLSW
ncbi:MAG TPA: fused MFS/spermidine synthase, partial [Kiritimatiellia bacterium]|nr:fused MFS/spermidine synthase [Kiritimatiellia bacterium]